VIGRESASLVVGRKTIVGGWDVQAAERPDQYYFDIVPSGKAAGYRGVAEFNGDVFRLCLGSPGASRPKRFASTPDGSATLYVLDHPKHIEGFR
jgi:hypothetical protein